MEPLYKKELNPSFWQNNSFNFSLRRKILKIVSNFLKEIELNTPIIDIRLTGSLANFNYNKFSDIDTHIILDFSKINEDKTLVKDMLDGKRFIWNLRHNIFLKGHEVELYFEDKDEPHISSGIFSLLKNEWVKEPKYNPPKNIDMEQLNGKVIFYTDIINRMEKLINETSDKQDLKLIHNKSKKLKDKIMKVRKEALQQTGEFALENLLFKKLRNGGIIEKLINVINMSYDKFFMESLQFNKAIEDILVKK
jgi:predicted nucleotidyltransferase